MKVAQIIDLLTIGGAQKLQVTFAEAARSHNLDVCLISLRANSDPSLVQKLNGLGVEVMELPADTVLDPFRMKALVEVLLAKRVDVIQTHLTSANIVGTLAGWLAGIPVVATLHSAGIDKKLVPFPRRLLETAMLKAMASRVVAVGRVVAETHRKRLFGKPIDVIHNAVSASPFIFDEERRKIREELVGDPLRPIFISVGRLSQPKGYPDLLEAFHTVQQQYSSAALLIAGGGALRQELEEQIEELGLRENVYILGFRDDVPRLLASADFYVSSSHWEGLPVSVLEAMSAGLPVIATNVGDLKDVVTTKVGLLVPPASPEQLAEQMISFLQSSDRMRSMGENARQRAIQHYSPDIWIARWIRLYSELIKAPARLEPETT